MWPLYNFQAANHDQQLVERWKRQTDTILTFAALFSIVDAIFLALALGGIRQNSTESLLERISLQLAQPNGIPLPDILPIHLTQLDIAVNVSWTLSLILSITCALAAHLVQLWSQEYLLHSQCHTTPSTRARIRAYLFDGLSQYRLDQVINAIPLLLHLAILLFGAGLIAYLFVLHPIIAYTALAAYTVVGSSYLALSISPLISLSSPFKTPISSLLWRALQLIQLTVLYVIQGITSIISPDSIFSGFHLPKMISACRERYRGGFSRAIEDDLQRRHSKMDAYSLRWAISCMKGHGDLESFIAAIPRFIDSERHCYPEITIGLLLEDPDVRLGWSIGRLLQTCASSNCALEHHIRKGRAIACIRATWYITEKFAGTDALFWDTLFGMETADSLSTLRKDYDPDIAAMAVCAAALAARSCLRELSHFSEWSQTKGPRWANRARDLVGYIEKLSGVALPVELDAVARDGPLIILGAFLTGLPFNVREVDGDLSFMVNKSVKHLTDGIRPSEATPDTQKQFSRLYPTSASDDWACRWKCYLDAAAMQSLRHRTRIGGQQMI
ncbi:hypothetical protein BC827DRAFT_955769 [Russula dissimulans]|nr:hypothetical protein BC827DRAFT_955769 [Russula dissimulans]